MQNKKNEEIKDKATVGGAEEIKISVDTSTNEELLAKILAHIGNM